MALTRRRSHHDILSWALVQIFYGDLNDNEQNMVDIASSGTFVEMYAEKSIQFMETLAENWAH